MQNEDGMNRVDDKLGKLQVAIEAGRERFDKDHYLDLKYIRGVVVPALNAALQDLSTEIEAPHMLKTAKVNHVIHYTSIPALVSMLQKAACIEEESFLRLYDSAHFNDPEEGKFFDRNLFRLKGHKLLKMGSAPHAYITSFIMPHEEKDLTDNLVFWATYGKEGMGCSLKLPVTSSQLRRVLYGTDKVRRTDQLLKSMLSILDDCLEPLISIPDSSQQTDVQAILLDTVAGYLEKLRYLYKSEAYNYENECRYVIPESVSNRDSIGFEYQELAESVVRIRHYYEVEELNLKKILVTGSSIRLGPRVVNPDNVRYYLSELLRRARLPGPKIRISCIPYQKR